MSDLIRRAEAIGLAEEAIHDEHISARASLYMLRAELTALPSAEAVHKPDYSYEADMVKRLRQAEAVQGWIPCSERLPAVNEVVLFCGKYNMFCGYVNEKGEWMSVTGDGWETDMDFPDSNKASTLAWMPLPEPYEPKTERRG